MEGPNAALYRAAERIHDALSHKEVGDRHLYLPESTWDKLTTSRRQSERAIKLGWRMAAERLARESAAHVDRLQQQLREVGAALRLQAAIRSAPSSGDIYRDLAALASEYEQVEADFDESEVIATTSHITLQGVDLGPFEVRFCWERLNQSNAYRVVALEPNRPLSNDAVSHPHVIDETLCEGDGAEAIRAALAEGRILDFFAIIGQLLTTYAPGRAYVELDEWEGLPCDDCGDQVLEEARYRCARCGNILCFDCTHACARCEELFCSGCLDTCSQCADRCCRECRDPCSACQTISCTDCLENEKCQDCHEEQEKTEPDQAAESSTALAVQSHGLGEAPVPA